MAFIHAVLEIQPCGTLQETAVALGRALGGLVFEEEDSGKYEEYPAYVARDPQLSYALLGIPEPEYDIRDVKRNTYTLQVESIGIASDNAQEDISESLARTIRENSKLICWE